MKTKQKHGGRGGEENPPIHDGMEVVSAAAVARSAVRDAVPRSAVRATADWAAEAAAAAARAAAAAARAADAAARAADAAQVVSLILEKE